MKTECNGSDKQDIRTNYLSLNNTTCLKGILAICIIFCHIWGELGQANPNLADGIIGNTIGRICTVLGYLSVALFLFLSGYGLCVQYQKKGDNYLKGFLVKRVLSLYLLNVVLIVFYSIVNIILGEDFSWEVFLQSFFFGKTIVSKGWYLQSILVWYLFFFVVFRFVKNDKLQIVGMLVAFILYLIVCLVMQLNSTWYEGSFCLVLGIIWAKFFKQINQILNKNKWLFLSIVIFGILFVGSFVCGNFGFLPKPLRIVSKSVSACMFSICVVLFLTIIPINNPITRFLGKISLEIYVFHGFFLMLYRCNYIYINNEILYSILVLISSIVLAFVLHPLCSTILNLGKRGINKNGNEN